MGSPAENPNYFPTFVPPPNSGSSTTSGGESSRSSNFSPAVIAIVGILGAAFLLVSYYTMVAKFCTSRGLFRGRRRHRRRGTNAEQEEEEQEQAGMTWPLIEAAQRGLDQAVIDALPVVEYRKGEGESRSGAGAGGGGGMDCAVCLSELEEGERVRMLPKCSHAFHLPCIDMWLHSHANCPICRAQIISTPAAPPEAPPATAAALDATADPIRQNHGQTEESENTGGSGGAEAGTTSLRQPAHDTPLIKLPRLDREEFLKFLSSADRSNFHGFRHSLSIDILDIAPRADHLMEPSMRRSKSSGTRCVMLHITPAMAAAASGSSSSSSAAHGSWINPASSTDSSRPAAASLKNFKSRSLNHERHLEASEIGAGATDSLQVLQEELSIRNRVIQSLNKAPSAVKRSFSGGRLFGFKVAATTTAVVTGGAATSKTRLPL